MNTAGRIRSAAITAVIAIAGVAAVAWARPFLDLRRPTLPAGYEDSDLMFDVSHLKGFALGFEGLIADWYWMRALQYIGGKLVEKQDEDIDLGDLRSLNPRLLYPYLDAATTLDPHFIAPYAYGAIVLPAIDPDKAIAIAEKGIANNPDQWRLYQHLGYIYWRLKRYDDAAATYEKGSEVAGAAPFMKLMAASMKTEGASRATARVIYTQMLADAADEQTRITAQRRLDQLDALDDTDAMNNALAEYKQRTGHCVTDLREINASLMNVQLPGRRDFKIDAQNRIVSPAGTPFVLDREKCAAAVDDRRSGTASNGGQ
ncbi:MAG: hypothetical protein HS105_04760 [Chloracidobacterium sp.]|nr:hypothetical protein [Chloracidobacterium sp.]MCO5333091.1 hypothetical protein [Pyrinomonadaceae bacterium]